MKKSPDPWEMYCYLSALIFAIFFISWGVSRSADYLNKVMFEEPKEETNSFREEE